MTLESRLEQLRYDVQFPPAPDVAANLAPHLAPHPVPVHWSRRLLLTAAIILILLALLFALPEARTTVANWLHAGGIRLELVDRFATNDDADVAIDSPLMLGMEIPRDQTIQDAGMPLFRLSGMEPDRVFVRQQGESAIVSLLYAPTSDLPEIDTTGFGALLMQVPAGDSFLPVIKKVTLQDGFEFADMDGGFGVWIPTGQLEVTPYDPGCMFGLETVRRKTGNVLIWEANGIGYRLETALPKDRAVELAESLVPLEGESGNLTSRHVVGEATTSFLIPIGKDSRT